MKSALTRAGAVLAASLAVVTTVQSAPATAAGGVCAGVHNCKVVARIDVNGDGTRDVVGVGSRGANGALDREVTVRVKTAPDRVVGARRSAAGFYGPLWQGAAKLDARRGRELVVGYTAGAHTEFFTALTWRKGRLVTLKAPGGSATWTIDGAYSVVYGWKRKDSDPAGLIRRRSALLQPDGTWTGKVTTFRWTHGVWKRQGVKTYTAASVDPFVEWGGFRVRGLQRW